MTIAQKPIAEIFAAGSADPIGIRIGDVVRGYALDGRDAATGLVPADATAEARNLLNAIERSIRSCGGTLDDVAQVTLRFADTARGLAGLNPIWSEIFPDPHNRPTYKFMPGSFADGRTVDAAYFAVLGAARRAIHIDGVAHTNPIPMAVRIGDYLFSSRVLPIDPANGRETQPATAQGPQVFANVQAVLTKAQMRWQDVTQGRLFLQDMTLAPALTALWAERTASDGATPPLHIQPYVTAPALQVMLEIIAHAPATH